MARNKNPKVKITRQEAVAGLGPSHWHRRPTWGGL